MTVTHTLDDSETEAPNGEPESQSDNENPTGLASLEHTVPERWGLILALYLAGIFMGALA